MILTAFGFGAFIFSLVGTAIVNPDNVKPDLQDPGKSYKYFRPEIADRIPRMYNIFFLCYLVLAIGAISTIHYPSEEAIEEVKAYE